MLSIGDFSFVCKVSTKTLRYYAKIGLIFPKEVNPENGYRYYAIEQLETMRLINRLKSYNFSLEEIKSVLNTTAVSTELLTNELFQKKELFLLTINELEQKIEQIKTDIRLLEQGKPMISSDDVINVQYVDVPKISLLFIRKMVHEIKFKEAYQSCFSQLVKKIEMEKLTITGAPMVLFHDSEFSSFGLDTEFAIPIQEVVNGSRYFEPGLCLKTVVEGSYTQLSSVYAKQIDWADKEGYECSNALFEMYLTDLTTVANENELVTEVYYPIRKRQR
ncbi:MerR family transcriptional regulator [Enterococcus sp. LJL99]